MFVKNRIGPPGCNVLNDEDRMPVLKVISGDTWVVDSELIAADGGPASPANSCVEFVLSENQFSPPIWTGRWMDGIVPDEHRKGLVHVNVPRDITKALRRGSYMFSLRVSDLMNFYFDTQLVGNFLVEYMPTSDQHSIPYRDGTSDIFCGSTSPCNGSENRVIEDEGLDILKRKVNEIESALAYIRKEKANKDEMSVTNGTGADSGTATIQLKNGLNVTVLTEHQNIEGKADKDEVARPYPYVVPQYDSGTVVLVPFSNNVLDMSDESMDGTTSFGVSVDNAECPHGDAAPMRDLWFVVKSSGIAPEISWPIGFKPANDDPSCFNAENESDTVFLVSEYDKGKFVVARQVMKEPTEDVK